MKTLFWILLLGNVVLFAVMQRGMPGWGEQAAQAQPALHEEMIRLLDASQSAPVEVLHASVPVALPVVDPAPLAAKPDTLACLEWGDFSGKNLTRATAALSALQFGDKLSQRQVEHSIGYWVYIPPLKNKAEINRKVAQLKARGVGEYFIVQDVSPWRNAISLGVFKTQEAAQNFLDSLRAKDVRTAQIGERASKLKATIFMLNGVDAATEVKLTAMQKDFAGSELKNVPCALTR